MGVIQWQKSLGGSYNDMLGGSNNNTLEAVKQTSDEGYVIGGYSNSNDGDVTGNHGKDDYWVVKLDASGTMQWQKSLGGTETDLLRTIKQTSDGGYVMFGSSYSNDGDVTGHNGTIYSSDYWLVKLDATGTIQWQKSMGGTLSDVDYYFNQTIDGGYIIGGHSTSNNGDVTGNHGDFDYWILKLSNISTGIEIINKTNSIVIYPNPNNGLFNIKSTIEGSYSIMNELGQTIHQIKLNSANNYTFNIDNLNNGIYFVVGHYNNEIVRQKIIVAK